MKRHILTVAFLAGMGFLSTAAFAQQACIPTNMNGSVFNIICPQTCIPVHFQVPHVKNSSDYMVMSIPYAPHTWVTPGGNEPTEIYVDDKFSHLLSLPFTVCFYGSLYNNFVIGSNGVVSFDQSQADCNNDYRLDFGPATPGVPQPIPHVGTGTCNQTNDRKYPPLSIMGPYHDLNPSVTATTPDRKVEWRVEGVAPCRKLVVSFYHIALYGDINSVNTSQIVVHESTGIIDVFIENKRLDQSGGNPWNANFAILGVQKDNVTAVPVAGKNCSVWQESNTGYRFLPSGAGSKFLVAELVDFSGNVIATADTSTVTPGLLDIDFPGICPPTGTTQYIIRTRFESCSNAATQIINLDTVTFNLTNGLNASAATTNTDCGVPTGTITVTIPPGHGNPPYSFVLDGGAAVSAGSPYTFTGVSAGPHTIDITDATGNCTSSVNVTVNRNIGIVASTSSTPASCVEIYDGTITIAPQNGVAPFSYQLDGFPPMPGTNPYTFTGQNSGLHQVVVYDATGCLSAVLNVVVPANAGVNGTTASVAATCPTAANGSITVTATTGTAPFSFSLDGGTPVSAGSPYTFTGVLPGPHTVLITDAAGCPRTLNVTVGSGPAMTAVHSTAATSCFGAANGSITISPVNGSGPYNYSVDGIPAVPGGVPHTFTNVAAGLHVYQVFDAVGCASAIFPVMVDAGPQLVTTAIRTHVLCNGDPSGSITVNPPPLGAPPFDYNINGGPWQGSNVFTGLAAGTYTMGFRSSNGCQGLLDVTIFEPPALTPATVIVPARCSGENNGTVTVNAGGGAAPYQYAFNGGGWQASNVFAGVAGNYTYAVRDANGCITTGNAVITQPAVLAAFSTNVNATCDGGSDGRIIINASGGNAGYRYSLDGFTFQLPNFFNVDPGTYNVTVRDVLGCTTSFTTTVGLTVNLFLNRQDDLHICEGSSGQLRTVSNATEYTWSPKLGLNDSTIASPVASPVVNSVYYLKAVLGRCTMYDTVLVVVHAAPVPDAGPDGDICYGQSYVLQGSGGFTYNWSPPIYLSSTGGANPVSTPSKTTVYTLSVLDNIGCPSLVTDEVRVFVKRTMKVTAAPFDTIVNPGAQFRLRAISPGITYQWSPAAGLDDAGIANPMVAVAGNIGETLQYEVVATDDEGCKAEGYVKLRIYKGPDIYVPTGFTPNGDGRNDLFRPVPVGIASYNYFRVFNRWGQLVFSTTDMGRGWDGRLDGREQPTGPYVWMVEGVTADKRLITKKGTVTLIR